MNKNGNAVIGGVWGGGNMEKCTRKMQRYGFCVRACQDELRVPYTKISIRMTYWNVYSILRPNTAARPWSKIVYIIPPLFPHSTVLCNITLFSSWCACLCNYIGGVCISGRPIRSIPLVTHGNRLNIASQT